MSNLNFLNAARTAPVAPVAPQQQTQRPKAQVWVNVGKTFPIMDDDGSVENVYVSVFGIPADVLEEPKPYTGKNRRMQQISARKIALFRKFKAAWEALAAGDALPVNGLELEMRRVGAPEEMSDEDVAGADLELDDVTFG